MGALPENGVKLLPRLIGKSTTGLCNSGQKFYAFICSKVKFKILKR